MRGEKEREKASGFLPSTSLSLSLSLSCTCPLSHFHPHSNFLSRILKGFHHSQLFSCGFSELSLPVPLLFLPCTVILNEEYYTMAVLNKFGSLTEHIKSLRDRHYFSTDIWRPNLRIWLWSLKWTWRFPVEVLTTGSTMEHCYYMWFPAVHGTIHILLHDSTQCSDSQFAQSFITYDR